MGKKRKEIEEGEKEMNLFKCETKEQVITELQLRRGELNLSLLNKYPFSGRRWKKYGTTRI